MVIPALHISELQQHMDDVLRFHSHSDPQIGASVAIVIGQFVRASLVHGCGQYNDFGRPSLTLSSLLEILCKVSVSKMCLKVCERCMLSPTFYCFYYDGSDVSSILYMCYI